MSNPNTLTYQLAAAVSNGLCLSQTPAAAGALTLNGSLVAAGVGTLDSGGAARRVLISSTGSDASVVFTVTGTSRTGNVQSSPVTGVVSGSPVATALDFLTVTAIASSAATAGAITAGTNGVGSSPWVVDDFLCRIWALSGGISGPAGTIYSLEHTYDDPNAQSGGGVAGAQQFSMNPASNVPPVAWPNAVVVNVSGANEFDYPNHPIFAHRLTIVSGTGKVTMQTIQAGNGSG
jgi:hypothetical protein